jgi:hypothetical protein
LKKILVLRRRHSIEHRKAVHQKKNKEPETLTNCYLVTDQDPDYKTHIMNFTFNDMEGSMPLNDREFPPILKDRTSGPEQTGSNQTMTDDYDDAFVAASGESSGNVRLASIKAVFFFPIGIC